MRLRRNQIATLSSRILETLKDPSIARLKTDAASILQKIETIIMEDLQGEDRLDEEVNTIMQKYQAQINSGSVNRHEMFQMIKKQLMKERKLNF